MPQGDLYAILAGLFWSISVILMRVSGLSIPAFPLTFFKSFVAIIGFVLLSQALREPLLPELSASDYTRLAFSALLGISVADTMFVASLRRLGASLQALADCVYAPAMAAVGFLMFGEILTIWEGVGGMLVVSGVVVGLRVTPEVASRRDLFIGVTLAAGAHVIMAVGILLVRDIYREVSVVWVSGFRFLVATFALGMVALCFSNREQLLLLPFQRRDLWKTMIPMALFGPFLATLCWVAGFKYIAAGRAAIYNQLSTVFIIVLAVLFLRERLTWHKALGALLAASGAALMAAN